jgi:hypothetical protein
MAGVFGTEMIVVVSEGAAEMEDYLQLDDVPNKI